MGEMENADAVLSEKSEGKKTLIIRLSSWEDNNKMQHKEVDSAGPR
jgi:hypothetical protein